MNTLNTSCSEFLSFVKQYQISYICNNYDIYCDDTCAENNNANCYCYCDANTIYCVNSSYYYFRFISVLLFGLFLSCLCCILYNAFVKNTQTVSNNHQKAILPAYDEIYHTHTQIQTHTQTNTNIDSKIDDKLKNNSQLK